MSVLIALCSHARDFSYTYEGQTVAYTVINEEAKTCMTKAANQVDGELILPSHPKDGNIEYSLIKIGDKSFEGLKQLYYIQLPETLEEIGANAFSDCSYLLIDEIPSSVSTIGQYAFSNCNAITSIELPRELTELGIGAFSHMGNLQKAVLFSQITEIPDNLCEECGNLETVYLPKYITRIGNRAFTNTAIENIILPESVEIIGKNAFDKSYNGGIREINWPENLKEIQDYAFFGIGIDKLDLNEGLEKIGKGAFWGQYLREINLPSTLKEVGEEAFTTNAFADKGGVVGKIVLPDALTKIGSMAFFGFPIIEMVLGDEIDELVGDCPCGGANILTIGRNVKKIERQAFPMPDILYMKPKTPPTLDVPFELTEQQIDNITFIVPDGAKKAYERNPLWNKFNILEESEAEISVHVDGYPISEEIRLQSGVMPSLVTKLRVTGTLAESDWRLIRENMASLISIDLSGITNTEIPEGAFENKSLIAEIIMPSGLKKIRDRAFKGCTIMNTPEIPETVNEIGEEAFADCNMLSISKLPNQLQLIKENTFSNCYMLSISKLPDALVNIERYAFENCKSLQSITAGSKLRQQSNSAYGPDIDFKGIFKGCTALESVDFSAATINTIAAESFEDCIRLKQIMWPRNLSRISSRAFYNTGLEAVDFPAGVNIFGSESFAETRIRGINVPEGTVEIGMDFVSGKRLRSVNLPSTLQTLTGSADPNIMALSCTSVNAPNAESGVFSGLSARRCSLVVPRQSYRSYLNAPQWGMFANLVNSLDVTIPDNVDVTAVDEEEYQEIVKDEELLAEAESLVEDEENENGDEPVQVKARRAARAAYVTTGNNYAHLFDGATLGSPKTVKGTRIFINLKPGAILRQVMYNNQDLTSSVVDGSLVLPQSCNGSLRIITDQDPDSIDEIEIDNNIDAQDECVVFDTTGKKVASGIRANVVCGLTHGIYILKSGTKTQKIIVK